MVKVGNHYQGYLDHLDCLQEKVLEALEQVQEEVLEDFVLKDQFLED